MIVEKRIPRSIWLILASLGALLIIGSILSLSSWHSQSHFLHDYLPVYSLVNYGICLGVLFAGILLTGSSIFQFSGKTLRQLKFLPLLVGAGILIFTLFLWNAIRDSRTKNTRAMMTMQAIHVKQEIAARLEFEMYAISAMAQRWEVRGGTPEIEWEADAKSFMDYYPNFTALQWVDADLNVQWSVPNIITDKTNTSVAKKTRSVLLSAKNPRIVNITDIVPTGKSNEEALYLYVPVYTHGIFSGYIVGVVDSKLFFADILNNEIDMGYAVSIKQADRIVFKGGASDKAAQRRWGKVATFILQDLNWSIRLWPTTQLLEQQGAHMPTFVLLSGVVIAGLLMLAIFLSQIAHRHARMVSVAHESLRRETIDRQRTEQVKMRLEKALQQSQKLEAIGTLAGGVAHDFNNILYAILGYVEMARQDVPKDTLVYKNLGKVLNAGQRGKKLVSSILSFSRQESHEFVPMDLVEAINVCFELLTPVIPANIELSKRLEVQKAVVFGSHTDIEQVVINVVNNAADAIAGYGKIAVHLEAVNAHEEPLNSAPNLVADRYFCIRIKDSGTGMDEVTLARLFEPFYTTKEVGSGTGLGLSMAHGIIENHHGIILANSRIGKGSTFYIYLPEYNSADQEK